MSYEFYKIMHIIGLVFLFLGLGGILAAFATSASVSAKVKGLFFACHGLGLLLMLVGGFGMAARLGLFSGLPGWVYGKIVIWLVLGGLISAAKRKSEKAPALIVIFVLLAGTAAYLAINKPF